MDVPCWLIRLNFGLPTEIDPVPLLRSFALAFSIQHEIVKSFWISVSELPSIRLITVLACDFSARI